MVANTIPIYYVRNQTEITSVLTNQQAWFIYYQFCPISRLTMFFLTLLKFLKSLPCSQNALVALLNSLSKIGVKLLWSISFLVKLLNKHFQGYYNWLLVRVTDRGNANLQKFIILYISYVCDYRFSFTWIQLLCFQWIR